MAKSKALTKQEHAPLTTKVSNGTPYQLDPSQVERAATALMAHMKKHVAEKEEKSGKKNLAADEDEADEFDQPIFLNISTKKHVQNTNRLKPTKISLPHTITPPDVRICIFTKDPQRAYKDLVASDAFPATLRSKVARVLGVDKLRKRYKSFEQKRQLLSEYDFFLVDDRVIKIVAEFLGKVFYQSKAKRPVPVRLSAGAWIDKKAEKKNDEKNSIVGTPKAVAKEIEDALNATYVSMSASANTSIKVGKLSMTPEQIKENVEVVVERVVDKHIDQQWRNVRSLHIKGPATKALPIWLADELWTDEAQVLDEPWKPAITQAGKFEEKKRKWEEWEDEMLDEDELAEKRAKHKSKKTKKPKELENKDKETRTISKEKRKKLKRDALQSIQTPLITGS